MIAYYAHHPRWPRLELRLVAYRPAAAPLPEGELKVVVQAMDAHGHPVAEDPLAVGHMSPLALAAMMTADRRDGWDFEPDRATAELADKAQESTRRATTNAWRRRHGAGRAA